jgi:hypothetical protein
MTHTFPLGIPAGNIPKEGKSFPSRIPTGKGETYLSDGETQSKPVEQPPVVPVPVPPQTVQPAQPAAAQPAATQEVFDMARIPYTQGTRAYIAAQAVLRGEGDNKRIAADTGLNLKTVQNVRSMIGRLRRTGAIPMGTLTQAATIVNDSSPSSPSSPPPPVLPPVPQPQMIPKPVAQPPIRERVPAQSARQEREGEEEMTEGKEMTEGNGRESSQEGDGRESLGKKSSPSRTLGKDIREAREGMRLVKDSQVGNEMAQGMPRGGLMDRRWPCRPLPKSKK